MTWENQHNKERFRKLKCCVILPTYNNEKTIGRLIKEILEYTDQLIVVNDGATDASPSIIDQFKEKITLITHAQNVGKGMALRNGFEKALQMGFDHAISIDSDGQHFPSDLPAFLDQLQMHSGALVIGSRNMNSENVPGGSSFGNKFSNFWFRVETG